jgi:hypothetical protein
MWNLRPLDTQPTLWGKTDAERWGALDDATFKLNEQFQKPAVMTGAQLALRQFDDVHRNPKAKCPFVPQREMVKKLWGISLEALIHIDKPDADAVPSPSGRGTGRGRMRMFLNRRRRFIGGPSAS